MLRVIKAIAVFRQRASTIVQEGDTKTFAKLAKSRKNFGTVAGYPLHLSVLGRIYQHYGDLFLMAQFQQLFKCAHPGRFHLYSKTVAVSCFETFEITGPLQIARHEP